MYLILHTMFQGHRSTGSGEEFKRFFTIYRWPYWSCDLGEMHGLGISLFPTHPGLYMKGLGMIWAVIGHHSNVLEIVLFLLLII